VAIEAPDFASLSHIEENLLVAKLEAIRKSIAHAGEKGRFLERAVWHLLRDLLPSEYGLGTGFVVWLSPTGPQLSRQLDIIIYDAIKSGPLIKLETCDVFPLEAVYGYVEVKASLRSSAAVPPPHDSIEACAERNKQVRSMNRRQFRVRGDGNPAPMHLVESERRSLRSFIFAFEADSSAGDPPTFAERMHAAQVQAGTPAHLHGVFIANHGLFVTRPVNPQTAAPEDYFQVEPIAEHSLAVFKSHLLYQLSTFERPQQDWVPAIDRYLQWSPLAASEHDV